MAPLACDDGAGSGRALVYALAWERPVGEHPVAIAAIDIDRDGLPELAVPALITPSLSLLHADGGLQTIEMPGGAVALVTADVDQDGTQELVVSMPAADLVQTIGFDRDGQPRLLGEVRVDSPGPLAAGDVDSDGDVDVLVTRPSGARAILLLGDGTGRLAAGDDVSVPRAASSVCLEDLDRDGGVDVAITGTADDEMWVQLSGRSPAELRGATGRWPMGATVAQLDDDAPLELVGAANLDDDLFLVDLAADRALAIRTLPWSGQPASVSAGDVDGDGHADLIVTAKGADRVDLLRGDGAGGLTPALSLATGWGPSATIAVDLDGDGCLDLATVNSFAASVTVHMCAPDPP
jgi:hypothetical protein